MTLRYSHLSTAHKLDAVQRLAGGRAGHATGNTTGTGDHEPKGQREVARKSLSCRPNQVSRPRIEPATRCLKGAVVVCAKPCDAIPGLKPQAFWSTRSAWDGDRWGPVPVHTRYTPSISRSWSPYPTPQARPGGSFWLVHADRRHRNGTGQRHARPAELEWAAQGSNLRPAD